MQYSQMPFAIATLLLSSALAFDPQHRDWHTLPAMAAPTEECRLYGQIEVLEGGGSIVLSDRSERPLAPGSELCSGDRVKLVASSRAIAVCAADGMARSLPVGIPASVTSVCPAVEECDLNNTNPGCGRNPDIFDTNALQILSPRDTALLTAQPTIRWEEVPGASGYTVTLEQGEVIWGPMEVAGTEIVYSGDAPLDAVSSYKLTVMADNGSTATTRFNLLSETDRADTLQILAMQPTDAMAEVPPQVYVYLEKGLWAEAIEFLEGAIASGNRSGAIYLQLGELYSTIELLGRAEEAYLAAIDLTAVEGRQKGEALTRVRLAHVYRRMGRTEEAISQLSEAKILYERVQDGDRVLEVEELLEDF